MQHTVFDARAAKSLAPGEHIPLAEHPGLRLVATATKRTWTYRYKDAASGLMKQTKLGEWPALGVSKAIEEWEKARGQRSLGIDVGAVRRAEKQEKREAQRAKAESDAQTVGWLVEQFLTDVVEPSRQAKGAAETRRMLLRAVATRRGIPAAALTQHDAHAIVADVAKTARRVAAMVRQELRATWEHGIARGLVSSNPFVGRTLGGALKAVKRERFLSDDEAGALLRWMAEPGTYSRTVRDALELTLRTGMRSGEVCGIHTRELTERAGVLWLDIPAARMKGGVAHSVPLVGRARLIVEQRMPDESGYLFPATSGDRAIAQKVLGVEVYACSGRSKAKAYAARKVCPVKDWAPHDLRRTARTMLAELGCPFEVGEAILAHQLPGVAAVYQRAQLAGARIEWLTKLGEHLDRLASAAPRRTVNRAAP